MRQRRWWLRYWLLTGGTFAIVMLSIYLAIPSAPRSGVNWDNADRIRPGMSAAEVTALFGEQPTTVTHENTTVGRKTLMWWKGEECDITVCVVQGNGVLFVDCVPPRGSRPSALDRFLNWLGF